MLEEDFFAITFQDETIAGGDPRAYNLVAVDPGFARAIGLRLLRGDAPPPGSREVLINESLLRLLGWEEAIGRELPVLGGNRIVGGVVRDVHFTSLHSPAGPTLFVPSPMLESLLPLRHLVVRSAPGRTREAVQALRRVWGETEMAVPFEPRFLDDLVDRMYSEERRWVRIVHFASALALAISSVGLLALGILAVQQRRAELAVRRVLGARARDLLVLMSGRFAGAVLLGGGAALPLAWIASRRWLESFAERIEPGPLPFLGVAAATLALALLTVALPTLAAARRSPTEGLRHE
jgi:putative ABC transport system permease protein